MAPPASLPPQPAAGPKAGQVYKNVQVLQNLSVGEFTRLMASITQWVSPQGGCAYCHNTNNMAEDSVYTKVVARRMIQMTQHTNADWTTHVAATGVTCYTCHRGQPVPSNIWFHDAGPSNFNGMAETHTGMAVASSKAGDSSLPYDAFTPYLEGDHSIRIQCEQTLPGTDRHSIKGIRMVRDLNLTYLNSLQDVFPPVRLGPAGDVAKVNCTTCHQGVYKPLFGVSMAKDFPELRGPTLLSAQ